MKSFKLFLLSAICVSFTVASSAQKAKADAKTETFNVSGNCGMCEAKIEKAAKAAGANYAEWDSDTKVIKVKFSSATSNLAKIQKSIADAGYDNVGAKAKDDTYEKLHSCCKYDRTANAAKTMECCKDGKCTIEGHHGKDCCTKDGAAKMDCCKDGKCTMDGHDGKNCCKKEN